MTDPRSTEPINRVGLYGCIHPVDQGSGAESVNIFHRTFPISALEPLKETS